MPSTMAYRRGDIVLVSFPFTDLTSSKRRPALVLTDDPYAVLLRRGDFAEGRLPKASLVKTTKLFTMHSSLVANPRDATLVATLSVPGQA